MYNISNGQNEIKVGKLGVCKQCFGKLKYTGNGSSFDGTENVDYLLSPFYYDGIIEKAIRKYKFNGDWGYSAVFADIMIEYLKHYPLLDNVDILVPVPLSKQRILERGYNQSHLLSEKISKYFNIPNIENALVRIRDTQKQSTLNGIMRYENVRGAFESNFDVVDGKRIMLVDDIFTRGCTMEECAKALKKAGAKNVIGLSLAYVYKKRNSTMGSLRS